MDKVRLRNVDRLRFVDLFAGCGGLSLGLINAGWTGYFAVEKDPMAFATYKWNLLDDSGPHFEWAEWLPQEAHDIGDFNRRYWHAMRNAAGKVDLVAAGPPCQGFSFLGKRERNDRRNRLFQRFLKVVDLLRPRFLLLENVPGIEVEHGRKERENNSSIGRPPKPYSHRIRDRLFEKHGYHVFGDEVVAKNCGVAQRRPRFFLVGIRGDLVRNEECPDPFEILSDIRPKFLEDRGVKPGEKVSAKMALSDLETEGRELVPCDEYPRFKRIVYEGPETPYQRMLHSPLNGATPDSLRLVNHRKATVEKFKKVHEHCRVGVALSEEERKLCGIRKHHLSIIDPAEPAPTISTIPDDQLHYSEPRVLTVREQARLQSFPDWFEFKGKYTTGGSRRRNESPRYTQVGNAVPPFMAELFGLVLKRIDEMLAASTDGDGAQLSLG